jgi:hypothetical protein
MSGNNAPNAVNQPPFPNLHVEFNGRVKCHVATLDGTTYAVTSTRSTAGITTTKNGTGDVTINFPAPGTGAIGWVTLAAIEAATPVGRVFCMDNDTTTNVATGVVRGTVFDVATPSAADTTGSLVFHIYVFGP